MRDLLIGFRYQKVKTKKPSKPAVFITAVININE